MKKNYFTLLLMGVFLLVHFIGKGQKRDTLRIQRNLQGVVTFLQLDADTFLKAQSAAAVFKEVLNLQKDDELKMIAKTSDHLGVEHQKFQQYYKGIKVEQGMYLAHGMGGRTDMINGDFVKVVIPSVTPRLREEDALKSALSAVNAKKYKWEDAQMEQFVKQNTGSPVATYYPKGELVICKDYLTGSNEYLLSWKFKVSSLSPNNEELIFIDAATGKVINRYSLLCHGNVVGSADTRYSGSRSITGDSYSGGYRLRESRNGVNIQTLNMQGGFNLGAAVDFVDNDNNWTAAEHNNVNLDNAALDVHWASETILDYWRTVHNRNSLNGSGLQIRNYVHFLEPNTTAGWPNNAAWDGNNQVMLYGDGNGFDFNAFTSLDLCGHEMGHGITQFTAGLASGFQESGALNEGFSDIWGACVEHWADPTKQTWLIMEDAMGTGGFSCLRDMQNPNSTLAKEGQHPDTYQGTFWNAGGEPHFNSTVLSHWFYLVSQGGSGTNDINNAFNVSGIGIDDAAKIAYYTEAYLLTSNANYAAARTASISAATTLFGANSCQTIAVTNAWHAVGLGAAYTGNIIPQITGAELICSSETYSVAGGTVTWSTTGALSTSVNGNSITLTKTTGGSATLTASIANACNSGTTVSVTKMLHTGTPFLNVPKWIYEANGIPNLLRPGKVLEVCYGFTALTQGHYVGASSVTWTNTYLSSPSITWHQANNEAYFHFTAINQFADFSYALTNACGTVTGIFKFQSINCPGGIPVGSRIGQFDTLDTVETDAKEAVTDLKESAFTIHPNPARSYVDVSFDVHVRQQPTSAGQKIALQNASGHLVKTFSFPDVQNKRRIKTDNLAPGLYIISIYNGQIWKNKKLIIQ